MPWEPVGNAGSQGCPDYRVRTCFLTEHSTMLLVGALKSLVASWGLGHLVPSMKVGEGWKKTVGGAGAWWGETPEGTAGLFRNKQP